MSRVLPLTGLVIVGALVLFLIGYWLLPLLAVCVLFCPIAWN